LVESDWVEEVILSAELEVKKEKEIKKRERRRKNTKAELQGAQFIWMILDQSRQ